MVSPCDPNLPELTFEDFSELKKADRAELMNLSPDEAQAVVEQVLHPRLWQIADSQQLAWPGDLADEE